MVWIWYFQTGSVLAILTGVACFIQNKYRCKKYFTKIIGVLTDSASLFWTFLAFFLLSWAFFLFEFPGIWLAFKFSSKETSLVPYTDIKKTKIEQTMVTKKAMPKAMRSIMAALWIQRKKQTKKDSSLKIFYLASRTCFS